MHLTLVSLIVPALILLGWILSLIVGLARHWRGAVLVAPVLSAIALLFLCTTGLDARLALKPALIRAEGANAYAVDVPKHIGPLRPRADRHGMARSTLKLYEDDKRLLPAHSLQETIASVGSGAFLHESGILHFSSSDGTDPRNNGRHYRIALRFVLSPLAGLLGWIGTLAVSALILWRLPRPAATLLSARAAAWQSDQPVRRRRVLTYVAIGLTIWLGGALGYSVAHFPSDTPTPAGNAGLPARAAYYLAHRADFNVIFLGDSRTYCGIHPLLIDPVAGTKSYSLAVFANWLPTQYGLVSDLAPQIPKSTTVVLSVGAQNFFQGGLKVQRVYPLSFKAAWEEWNWGLRQDGLWDNTLYYNRLTHFLAAKADLRQKIAGALGQSINLPPLTTAAGASEITFPELVDVEGQHIDLKSDDADAQLQRIYGNLPGVGAMKVNREDGKIISVVLYLNDGTYYRIELLPSFFRAKQAEMFPPNSPATEGYYGQPDPAMMKIFNAILDKLKAADLKVIVNIVEETPLSLNPGSRQRALALLEHNIRPIVEQHGFGYIHIDWSQFSDADYFDYNHLNSVGSKKAAALIGAALKSRLQP